jgi:hypothetical protein
VGGLSPLVIIQTFIQTLRQLIPSVELTKSVVYSSADAHTDKMIQLAANHSRVESIEGGNLIRVLLLILQIERSVPVGQLGNPHWIDVFLELLFSEQ